MPFFQDDDTDLPPGWERAKAAPYDQPRTMVAAAMPLKLDGKASERVDKRKPSKWQVQAWRMFDAIGELHYSFGMIGSVVSRVRFFPALVVDGGTDRDWCIPGVVVVQSTTWTPSTNRGCIEVIELARTMTFDRVGGEVVTPGTASTVIRGGIYTADEHWQADDLVLDWGPIAADAAAFHSLTINLTLTPGRYVVCWTPGSSPTLRGLGTYWPHTPLLATTGASILRAQGSNLGGNTNALPSSAGSQQKWATATGTTVAQRQNFWRFREAA